MTPIKTALIAALTLAAWQGSAHGADPDKKALVAKIVKMQQAQMEQFALGMAQQPMQQMLRQAEQVVGARVPTEKREATAKAMVAEAQSAMKDLEPALKASAIKQSQATYGAALESKFSAAELKEIVQVMESPTMRRFGQMGPELNQAMAQAIANDTKASVEPRLKALDQKLVQLVNAALPTAPAASPKP